MQRSVIVYAFAVALLLWAGLTFYGRAKHPRMLAEWEPYRENLAQLHSLTASVEWVPNGQTIPTRCYIISLMKPSSLSIEYWGPKADHYRYVMSRNVRMLYKYSLGKPPVPVRELTNQTRIGREMYLFAPFFARTANLPFNLFYLVPVDIRQDHFQAHAAVNFEF